MDAKNEILLLTRKEAAKLFAVSASTIDRWRKKNLIPYVKLGDGEGKNQTIRFRKDQLLKIIEENTIPTAKEIQQRLFS